jgi:hypothetical protein
MAPCASFPQPEKADCSSGRTADQTLGQEDARGRRLSADVVDERRRRKVRGEVYNMALVLDYVILG